MKVRSLLDKERCVKSPTGHHLYKIIKESGYMYGSPLWKCEYCSQTIKSS